MRKKANDRGNGSGKSRAGASLADIVDLKAPERTNVSDNSRAGASLADIADFKASDRAGVSDHDSAYRSDEGTLPQWLAVIGFSVAAALLAVLFHTTFFRGYDMEALDVAQVARNLSQGQGFSTDFIRPYLLPYVSSGKNIPDFSNAPLYPLILGWVFAFLGETGRALAALPILLLAISSALLFVLAHRLTHSFLTACLAVSAYLLSQPVLATVDSARPIILSTCLLLLLLLKITPFSGQTDEEALAGEPAPAARPLKVFRHHFAIGFLVGLCYLADYFSLFYVIPLLIWWPRRAVLVASNTEPRAGRGTLGVALGIALVVTPWLWRNFALAGNPFYSTQWLELVMNTQQIPGFSLLRDASGNATIWPGAVALLLKFVRSLVAFFIATPFLPHIFWAPLVLCVFWLRLNPERMNRFKKTLLPAFLFSILGLSLLGRSPAYLLPLVPLMSLLGAAAYVHLAALWLNRLKSAAETGRGQKMRWLAPASTVLVPLVLLILPLSWNVLTNRDLAANRVDFNAWFQPLRNSPEQPDNRAIASDMPWAVSWYADRRTVWLPGKISQLAAVERKLPLAGIYLSPAVADPRAGFTNGQEWLPAYQGAREMQGFARIPRAAQRDVFFAKLPTLNEISKVAQAQPKNPVTQLQLAETQLKAGRYSAALTTYKRFRTLVPRAPHSYLGEGKAQLGLKAPDKALVAFEQAIQRAGKVPAIRIEAQLRSADILTSRGNQKAAVPLYEAVLADQPNHPIALNNLAFIYANDDRNLNRALEMARRAVASNPKNGLIRDTLGLVCLRLNRPEEAVEHLREAVRLAPKVSSIRLHLDQALKAAGQK